MKKSLIRIFSILAIVGMTSSGYAANYTNTVNNPLTVGTTSNTGGQLTCEISPGVLANVATNTNSYGIVTVNPKAGTDAIGYNVHSASGAVFLKTYTSSAPTTADAAADGKTTGGYASK
nr:hypothetical protein [uncultured Desulfobacter sp.]